MGAYDAAEVCEIVGLFLLNNLANKFDKNSVGLYRDDGLALFKNIIGHRVAKIRKEFHQLFKENGLSLEMQPKNCRLSRYYFRLTYSNTGNHMANLMMKHFTSMLNRPVNILKQLPISIETRLFNLSSNPEIFHEASKHYQNIKNQCEYDCMFLSCHVYVSE